MRLVVGITASVAVAFALVAVTALNAQVTAMTPETISQAIEAGKSGKGLPDILTYAVTGPGPEMCGTFSTPFSRVAFAAEMAAHKYQSFGEGDVTAEMVEPKLIAYASAAHGNRVSDVVAIVVAPHGSKDLGRVTKPISTKESVGHYKNGLGVQSSGTEMEAAFPLSVVAKGNELRFVYSDGVECVARFDVSKLK